MWDFSECVIVIVIVNELARQRSSSSRCVSIPTCHRTHEPQLVWSITVLHCETPSQSTSSQTRAQVGDKMTGDAATARTGLALCHRVILDSVAHWWVQAGHPRYTSASTEEGRGWPTTSFTRQHRNDKTNVYTATPWLPTNLCFDVCCRINVGLMAAPRFFEQLKEQA